MADLHSLLTHVKGTIEDTEEISGKIKELSDDIKMVSINIAIETAHATSYIVRLNEILLNDTLVGQCRLMARMLASQGMPMSVEGLAGLAREIGLDEIYIADGDGVVVATNNQGILGWRFPDDPREQAYPFRQLIEKSDGVYCQNIQKRSLDNQSFKYVGISRSDAPGLIQIGLKAEKITDRQIEIGSVFAVMSKEIGRLSDEVAGSSKAIKEILKSCKNAVKEYN